MAFVYAMPVVICLHNSSDEENNVLMAELILTANCNCLNYVAICMYDGYLATYLSCML